MLTPGSSGSLRLLVVLGIPIRVHFTFLFMVMFFGIYAEIS